MFPPMYTEQEEKKLHSFKGSEDKEVFKEWTNSEIKKVCLSLTQMEIEGSSGDLADFLVIKEDTTSLKSYPVWGPGSHFTHQYNWIWY